MKELQAYYTKLGDGIFSQHYQAVFLHISEMIEDKNARPPETASLEAAAEWWIKYTKQCIREAEKDLKDSGTMEEYHFNQRRLTVLFLRLGVYVDLLDKLSQPE